MSLARRSKFPRDRLRVGLDFTDWLDDSEQITAVTVTTDAAAGSTLVAGSPQIDPTGKKIIYYVTGGVAGERVDTFPEITTSATQVKDVAVAIIVKALA